MMNTVAHPHANDTYSDPSFFTSHNDLDLSLWAQAEGLLSAGEMVDIEEHSIFNELATPWLNWNYSSTFEWIGLIPSRVQLNLSVDPRLTIGEPEAMRRPSLVGMLRSSTSGSGHEAYGHDAGVNLTQKHLQETSVLDEGSITGDMFTTFVGNHSPLTLESESLVVGSERNLEANPEATEAELRVVTHGIRGAKSGGKWRSGVELREEMYHNKIVTPGSANPTKQKAPRTKVRVVWVGEDDGQEPDLERDSLGYAIPTAAFDRAAQGGIKVECMDRLFFPPTQKHAKSLNEGHICHVQRKIVHQGQGQVAWAPVVTKCKPQKSADSYKRHLLNCHLATPRANGKRCNLKVPQTRVVATATGNTIDYGTQHAPQSSAKGSRVRKRKRDIEDDGANHSRGKPSAQNHSKRPRIA